MIKRQKRNKKGVYPPLPHELIAQILDVTPRRVRMMIPEGLLESAGPGVCTAESVLEQLRIRRGQPTGGEENIEQAKRRKAVADADLAETEAAKAIGKLVPAAPAKKAWESAILAARTKLLALPARLGPLTYVLPSAKSATECIEKELRSALEGLGQLDLAQFVEEEKEEEAETEAEEDADYEEDEEA